MLLSRSGTNRREDVGHPGAPVVPDHREPLEPQPIGQVEHVGGERVAPSRRGPSPPSGTGCRRSPATRAAPPVAGVGEPRGDGGPAAGRVGPAVQQQDRAPVGRGRSRCRRAPGPRWSAWARAERTAPAGVGAAGWWDGRMPPSPASRPCSTSPGRSRWSTGSSRGIGRALAEGLAGAGATVVRNGRDPARLARMRESSRRGSGAGRVHAYAFDVTDEAAVDGAIARSRPRSAPSATWSTTPACSTGSRSSTSTWPTGTASIDTDLTSAFLVGRAVARGMISRGRGKIINIASVQSDLARPHRAVHRGQGRPAHPHPRDGGRVGRVPGSR